MENVSTLGPILVSVKAAQKMLGLSAATIWRMMDRGELERVHIGRRVMIKTASVERVAAVGSGKNRLNPNLRFGCHEDVIAKLHGIEEQIARKREELERLETAAQHLRDLDGTLSAVKAQRESRGLPADA